MNLFESILRRIGLTPTEAISGICRREVPGRGAQKRPNRGVYLFPLTRPGIAQASGQPVDGETLVGLGFVVVLGVLIVLSAVYGMAWYRGNEPAKRRHYRTRFLFYLTCLLLAVVVYVTYVILDFRSAFGPALFGR